MRQTTVTVLAALSLALCGGLVCAASQYGPGVSDAVIKIGNTAPYSGPASAYGVIAKSAAAYFAMINDRGGINGRKIDFISRDDGYSPPRTLAATRELVEQQQVLLLFSSVGTATNTAIRDYLNDSKVPQLFITSGAGKWNDPKRYPWTMGWLPNYQIEARIYARYILKHLPHAKVAVLYQNDDAGKDYLAGLRQGLGAQADKLIVATQTYETSDPTIDSQLVALRASGADVLLTEALPKFAAQAIRKIYEIGWKPTHFLSNVASSVKAVMRPAGAEKTAGIITAGYLKEPTDPLWRDTPEYRDWLAWMEKYNTAANVSDDSAVYGYSVAQTLVAVLRACGDDLSRANVMRQAASIHDLTLPMLLPGITISTGTDDFAPIEQMQLERFDGITWRLLGDVISGSEI